MALPIKSVALNHPLSDVVSFKSHSAEGSKNEMHSISTASLALAQPQTSNNQ
jgi:hypothetical protein